MFTWTKKKLQTFDLNAHKHMITPINFALYRFQITSFPYKTDIVYLYLIPASMCHCSHSVLLTVYTSTACSTLGRCTLSGSVAPHPATMERAPIFTGSGLGRHTGEMCGMRVAGRSSFRRATS